MTEISELLKNLRENSGFTYDEGADPQEMKVAQYNRSKGNLRGYECAKCNNRGYFMFMEDEYERYRPCECMGIRKNLVRIEKSGLKDVMDHYTFEKYSASSEWQKSVKSSAERYAENPQGWFFIGGQVGSGKTHICTAVTAKLLNSGKSALYMLWRDAVVPIKANVTDESAYLKLINPLKTVDVLYIDDFLKSPNSKPTPADINIAYEIINYRYINRDLITVISSEKTVEEIIEIDEATGSRIFEKTRGNCLTIDTDATKNYRTHGGIYA